MELECWKRKRVRVRECYRVKESEIKKGHERKKERESYIVWIITISNPYAQCIWCPLWSCHENTPAGPYPPYPPNIIFTRNPGLSRWRSGTIKNVFFIPLKNVLILKEDYNKTCFRQVRSYSTYLSNHLKTRTFFQRQNSSFSFAV